MNTTEYIITICCLVFSYVVSVMVPITFQAWIAKKCGDYTAQQAGFLTLNPSVYFTTSMVVSFLISLSGLGRIFLFFSPLPITTMNIQGSWRRAKIFFTYTSGSFIHILIAFISTFLLMYILKLHHTEVIHILAYANSVLFLDNNPLRILIQIIPSSSLLVIFSMILLGLIFFNIFFAGMQLVFNTIHIIIRSIRSEESCTSYTELRNSSLVFMSAMIIFMMIGDPFSLLINKIIIMGVSPMLLLLRTMI
jgi:hypothetical protein